LKVDDLMCFEFDSSAGRYEAFNRGAPNYFLSEESRELFREQHRTRRDHIIGQVVFIMEFVAVRPPLPPPPPALPAFIVFGAVWLT
jgi:hypothetical protein